MNRSALALFLLTTLASCVVLLIAMTLMLGGRSAFGGSEFRLTYNSETDRQPSWGIIQAPPPAVEKIIFASERDGNGEIYVMNTDGTSQTNVTNNAAEDYDPSFSGDASKIAFASFRDGNWEIYVMNIDTRGPVGGIAELPDVSGSSGRNYALLASAIATAVITLTAGAWYARRSLT